MTRRTFLILLVSLALAVRGGAILSLRHIHDPPDRKTAGADAVEFNVTGLHLAQGLGYNLAVGQPTSFRAPGFPFFLAALYWFSPANYPLVYIFLCLMGAITCVITYYLGRELLAERPARIAAILCALYLPHVYFATIFYSENLCAPLIGLVAWLFIRYLRGGSAWNLAGSGLALGYCALVRPFSILLMLLLGGFLVVHHIRSVRLRIGNTLLFVITFSAVILPWTLRNYQVHGHFVLIATNGGSTFYGSNNDIVSTQFRELGQWVPTGELPGRPEIDKTPTEYLHDQLEWHLGIEWVRNHLLRLPALEVCKLIRLWLPDTASRNTKYDLLQLVGYTPYMLLFFVGFYFCAMRQQYRTESWLLIHVAMFATVLTALVFYGSTRFRDANVPILMLYAAIAIDGWVGRHITNAFIPARVDDKVVA